MKKWNIKELNTKLPSLGSLYDILVDSKGYYLPDFKNYACSRNYLLKIVKDESVFKVLKKEISEPPIIKQQKSVEDLLEIITEIIQKNP